MKIRDNLDPIVKFLRNHVRGGLIFLMAMLPLGGVPLARTFRSHEEDELREFLEPLMGKRNIYFGVNPIKRPLKKKPSKADMASMSYLYVDIDLRPGLDRETELERILERISAFSPRPTTLISSGNGFQAIWLLAEPMLNDGDYDALEALNKQLEALHGGDACHNIDRILRVPGTLNLPTKKKKALNYTEVMSELVWQEDRSVRAEDFELLPEPAVELLRTDGKLRDRWLADATGLKDNSRSGFDLSLVAMLKGEGLSREDTEKVLRVFPYGQYSDTKDKRAFARCWKKAGKGGRAGADGIIKKMNKEYAVVIVGGKVSVLWERRDSSGELKIDLLSLDAFNAWFGNRRVKVPVGDKIKWVPLAKFWLGHRGRRQYSDIVFSPNQDVAGAYNLWRGFQVTPKKGDWSRFREHLLDNVCGGDESLYRTVFGWWANLFQNPDKKVGTALVLRGKQGVGKSIIGVFFGHLIGRAHYRPVADQRFLTGQFNAHMMGCLLLQADEAIWAGDKKAEGSLKNLITAARIPVEFKGKEVIWIENHVLVFITTNSHWAVPAGMEERRFITLDVGEEKIQDHEYFSAMVEQFENSGAEALMYDLLKFDLDSVDLRAIPKTDALRDQKAESLPVELHWYLDLLMRGQLPGDVNGLGFAPAARLYDHFIDKSNKVGERRKKWEMTISKMLQQWVPGIEKSEGKYSDRYGEEKRGRIWHFPPLDVCRAAFDEESSESWPWEEQAGWIANDDDSF